MKFNAWSVPLLLVCSLLVFFSGTRIARLVHLSALPSWSVEKPAARDASATGYAHGWRNQLVIDPTSQSQQWIAQAQALLHDGKALNPQINYDNAPHGRTSSFSPLYRWWLAALALVVSLFGATRGASVEMASLFCDPLLQLLAAAATGWYTARRLGTVAGALVALQLLTLFPFSSLFLPGLPHTQGAAELLGLWQLLLLVTGFSHPASNSKRRGFVAGLCGGLGMSLNFTSHLSLLVGIGAGAAVAVVLSRNRAETTRFPWRAWALGGCLSSLGAYALVHFKDLGELRLESLHPYYSLLWWLLGEWLHALENTLAKGPASKGARITVAVLTLVLTALLSLPLLKMKVLLSSDISVDRLTRLDGGYTVGNTFDWWTQDRDSLRFWTTLIPAGMTVLLLCFGLRKEANHVRGSVLVVLSGAFAVVLLLAFAHLRWWNTFNILEIAIVAALTAHRKAGESLLALTSTLVAILLGLMPLAPPAKAFHMDELDPSEMRALLERDLAQWISQRKPEAIVLAPPEITGSLWYYGGLRGVTTFDPENKEGFMGGLRIAASTTAQEAQVLIRQRGITHLVLPSWDRGLVEAARDVSDNKKSQFLEQLGDWILPGWTRPVSYFLPSVDGFERESVVTLEVVDDAPDVALLTAMATYFVEMGMVDHATQLRPFLKRFPNQLEALVALAEIEHFRKDDVAFKEAVKAIELLLDWGAGKSMAWERRLALAATLVKAGETSKALLAAKPLFAQAEEQDLRGLSARSLFRALALERSLQLAFGKPSLEPLALSLLPPDLRHELP